MNNTLEKERYHSLDGLRAIMMLLGVYIHAVAALATIPDVWWLKDSAASTVFDIQLLAIHTFRMPVFFAMAGFFAALLIERRGYASFSTNRIKRVFLPLVVSVLTLIPLMKGLQLTSRLIQSQAGFSFSAFWADFPLYLKHFNAGHMWFLLALVYLYVLALALRFLVRPVAHQLDEFFAWLTKRAWSATAFGLACIPVFAWQRHAVLPAPQGFLPDIRALAVYLPFVLFGWALYCRRELLPTFVPTAMKHLWLGLFWMTATIAATIVQMTMPEWNTLAFWATAICGSLCVWEMMYALLGLFQRFLSRQRPVMRYLSDASYWIYLMHSPVLLIVQIPLMGMAWGGALKLLVTLFVVTPILLLSYDLLARPSWIGLSLNGRRFPSVIRLPLWINPMPLQAKRVRIRQ